MKKMIALMLCFLLLMGCAVSVSAADTTKVEIIADKAEAKPGDEITFEVRIDGSETCKSIGIALQYDKTVFEIKEGKCGLENATLSIFDESVGFAYLFQDGVVPEGTVGTFTMQVKEGAVNGETEVSGQLAVKSGDKTIPAELTAAGVTITDGAAEKPTEKPTEKPDASTDTAQKVPAQTEPHKQPGGIQPQKQTGQEKPQKQETHVIPQPSVSEQETEPQVQPETPKQEQPAVNIQPETEQESPTGLPVLTELLIAAAVLIALISALVVCLVLLAKRRKNRL